METKSNSSIFQQRLDLAQCMPWIIQMLDHFHHTDGFKHPLLTLLTRIFGQIYLAKKKLEVSSWLKNVNRNRIGHIRKSRRLNASPRSQIKHITDFHHIFPNQESWDGASSHVPQSSDDTPSGELHIISICLFHMYFTSTAWYTNR